MRTALLWIVLVLSTVEPAVAQLRGGFLGGITIPQFSDQTRYNSERRFQAGLLGSYQLLRPLTLQAEFYYSEIASKAEEGVATTQNTAVDDTTITSIRLNYFEAPGMVRFNVLGERGYVAIGGAIGMKLRCNVTITEQSIEREAGCEYKGRELIEQTNIAPVLVIGGQLRVLNQILGGDIRVIGGWTEFENARRMTIGRATQNYSIALTGRVTPVLTSRKDDATTAP
jgi:hypothetical protein